VAVTKKTLAEAIACTGRSKRTLRRWKALGCNLGDRASLEDFAARSMRRSRGKATRQIAKTQRPVAAAVAKDAPLAGLNGENGQDEDGPLGALGALQRLRNLERSFYSRLKELLKSLESNRPDLVSSLLGDYTKASDSLRRYERALELEQHDLLEFIPKRDAIEAVEAVARWMRLSVRRWESSHLPELLAISDPRIARLAFEESFVEIVVQTVKAVMSAAQPIPLWASEAVQKEWRLD